MAQHHFIIIRIMRLNLKLCLSLLQCLESSVECLLKENANSGKLRDGKEFTDVTLAREDGRQVEAHKVILAIL